MSLFTKAVTLLVAALASIQLCPAPIKTHNRRDEISGGLSNSALHQCHTELYKANLVFDGKIPNAISISGVPDACVYPATLITGRLDHVAQGNNTITFDNIKEEYLFYLEELMN